MESKRMFNLINKYTHNRKHEPQSRVEYVLKKNTTMKAFFKCQNLNKFLLLLFFIFHFS